MGVITRLNCTMRLESPPHAIKSWSCEGCVTASLTNCGAPGALETRRVPFCAGVRSAVCARPSRVCAQGSMLRASKHHAFDLNLSLDFRKRGSHHAARHEASNRQTFTVPHRPHHCPAEFVGYVNYGVVRNINPLIFDADPIVTIVRFPVGIINHYPSANEQHRPLRLARRSNHSFSGELA